MSTAATWRRSEPLSSSRGVGEAGEGNGELGRQLRVARDQRHVGIDAPPAGQLDDPGEQERGDVPAADPGIGRHRERVVDRRLDQLLRQGRRLGDRVDDQGTPRKAQPPLNVEAAGQRFDSSQRSGTERPLERQ
jgi:hypothetical protein